MKYFAVAAIVAFPALAFAQGSILQAGPPTAQHAPMYTPNSGFGQAAVQDSGPAGGGNVGLGLSEVLQVNPSATPASGTGPLGTHDCHYSAPVTSAGYYYLCFDARGSSGGILAYGNAGTAPALPFQLSVNGVTTTLSALTFPPAGIANSNGANWASSYSTTGSGSVVALATGPTILGGTFTGTFAGNPTLSGNVTLSGAGTGLTVTNNATVGGMFAVTGNTTLNGSLTTLGGSMNATTSNNGVVWTPLITGTTTNSIAPVYFAFLDEASTGFSTDFQVVCNLGLGGYGGGRACLDTLAFNSGPLPSGNTNSGNVISAQLTTGTSAPSGGSRGSCIQGTSTCTGGLWAADSQVYVVGAGTGWAGVYAHEFDIEIDSASASASKTGILVQLSHGDGSRGYINDTALQFGGDSTVGWKTVINLQEQIKGNAGLLTNTDSTLMNYTPLIYSASNNTVNALYGVDWRYVTFTTGGCAFSSPGYCINPTGNAYSAGVTTTGNIQAQTATLASITISDGGAFDVIPSLTIQAPPSGTTATATVTTMGLSATPGNGFYAIINNGTSGCTNGATVTVSGGTSSGVATGTATVVGGVVKSIAIATAGTYSALPSNPVTLTGSGCSGALTATLTWGITGISTTGGSGYLLYPAPVIYPSSVTYQAPILTAVMTGSNATLALNPAGAVVSIGAANLGGLTLAPYTIANLPSCVAGIAGDMVYISNGVASPTRGATVSTTGAVGTYVVCNGSNWTY